MEEENVLEYRPSFEREERLATNWATAENTTETTQPAGTTSEDKPGSGIVTETIGRFEEVKAAIKDKLAAIEKAAKKIVFPIKESQLADILRAKEALGLTGDTLTIVDYRKALEEKDTAAGDYLLEIIEDWIESVDGSIQLELYAEYFQLMEETNLMETYLSKILFSSMGLDAIDYSEKDWSQKLMALEKEWYAEQESSLKRYNSAHDAHLYAFLKEPSLIEKTKGTLYEEKKVKRQAENRLAQANEATILLRAKTDDIEDLYARLNEEMERIPYENTGEVVLGLLETAKDTKNWQDNLTNFGLMLTLSVDVKNREKHHLKNTLRHTYSPSNREKLLDELTVYDDVYQKVTLDTLHASEVYNESSKGAMAILLNQVADGLLETSTQKKAKTKEFNTLMRTASSLQWQTIEQTTTKDDARQGYHLMNTIREKTIGSGMPDRNQLSGFLES